MEIIALTMLLVIVFVGATGILAIVALVISAPLWLRKLADQKLFVTIPEEGTAEWIMKNGKAWRCITSDATIDPDPDECDITREGVKKGCAERLKKDPDYFVGKLRTVGTLNGGYEEDWVHWIDKHLKGGMRWVGVPWIYSIYDYNFRWAVLRESKPLETEDSIIGGDAIKKLLNGKYVASFAKRIRYIFLRDAVYYFGLNDAETQGADNNAKDKSVGMAVKIDAQITVRIINPYRALFVVHDWLESSLDLLRPAIRSWIASKPYQDVVGKIETANRTFEEFLSSSKRNDVKDAVDYLEKTYGVRIKRIAFEDINPPDEYTKATTKRAEAVQKAVRIETLANAKAKRIEIIAKAEAARIREVNKAIKEGGETAMALRTLEAYEAMGENGNTIIVGGNSPINMLVDSSKNRRPGQQPPQGRNNSSGQGGRQ